MFYSLPLEVAVMKKSQQEITKINKKYIIILIIMSLLLLCDCLYLKQLMIMPQMLFLIDVPTSQMMSTVQIDNFINHLYSLHRLTYTRHKRKI